MSRRFKNNNNSIKAYSMKSLYNLKKSIGDDSLSPYFELLSTEVVNVDTYEEIIQLQNIEENNEVLDSPFSQISGRTAKDIDDFITYIDSLIKIREGNSEVFNKLFPNCSKLKILELFNKWIVNNDLEAYLLFLEEISKFEIELCDIELDQSLIRMQEEWNEKKLEVNSKELPSIDAAKVSWLIFILSIYLNNQFYHIANSYYLNSLLI